MGMYTSIRGWLEIDHAQRGAAEAVIARHHHELYSGGWAFPVKPFNWTLYLFFGGDIRDGAVDWFRAQVRELAALTPIDDDGDRPDGMFLLTDEYGTAVTWHVRDGAVTEGPAGSLRWFAGR
ncbi:hypothetical protein [Actinoplanes sp. G11-F43]|uniref:hypothetical protein n=1 Tax=Actinoplanes sp. G11-F43 TaxID=3424130 RepID=UPI003D348718